MSQPTSESRVRVGIRIRPLTAKEINQGGKNSLVVTPPSIKIAQRPFTYDTVFDSNVGQEELYDSVATPLLQGFADGYNATIMAYGQTGSGKTFTMGSEAHTQPETSSHVGLIPRFISEIFHQMQQKKESSDKAFGSSPTLLDYSVSASFLEVYGEDVYDLLDADRKSLPLREDSAGGVVITGLTHRSVSNPSDTLQVLHEGTMNRTTAATLMNLTSSRSHAVFTIYLTQVVRSDNSSDVDVTSTSRFTFVDLAGSERMKKTGAEGERAREGIKINEGLLALGNVINALADEERIAKEKKIHVPYRQSKLTRLLQDALGGNSQTLFLACVSPSDTNVSETLSTLHYANRARNIRNAPTKNVDATAMELQRLHTLAHVLQCELIKTRFQDAESRKENIGFIDNKLMDRSDVEEYIRSIHRAATELAQTEAAFPIMSLPPASSSIQSFDLQRSTKDTSQPLHTLDTTPNKTVSERFDDSFLVDVNPDEDMAILDHLLELQQQDHAYDTERKKDDERLKIMNGELEREETMLLKIRDSLKAYHNLKRKYEELMAEVQQLESEKASLADQLEKTKTDPSKGCSAAIKKQLEKVELSLSRTRRETRSHRQKFKIADEQAKKSRILERKIDDLKQAKRVLVRKQKEDLVRYKATMDAKTKELLILKRKDKAAGRKMSKLENEIQHHRNTLDKRQTYCTQLSEKLKKTESHLLRLLTLRQRDLEKRTSLIGSRRSQVVWKSSELHYDAHRNEKEGHGLSKEEWNCTRFIFTKMVWDKVDQAYLQNLYEERMAVYSDTMRKVMAEAKRLNAAKLEIKGDAAESITPTVHELEETISELELKLELLGSELSDIRIKMPEETKRSVVDSEEAVSKMMKTMPRNVLRMMLLETMSKLVAAETERKNLAESLDRKDAALLSFESEVESLTNRVTSLSKDLIQRKLVSESGMDPFDNLKCMKQENTELEHRLQDTAEQCQEAVSSASVLKHALEKSMHDHAKAQEMVACLEASLSKQGGMVESADVLERLQEIWEQLGVDVSFRDKERQDIQSSLVDTCSRKLNDALVLKTDSERTIELLAHRLDCMRKALGMSMEAPSSTPSLPLLKKLHKLQHEFDQLVTPYKYACARREKILNDTIGLSEALGICAKRLPMNLKILLQQADNVAERIKSDDTMDGDSSADTMTNGPLEMDTKATATTEGGKIENVLLVPPQSLENAFLSICEADIKDLRVQKSKLLVKNREMQQKIAEIVKELHMSTDELLSNMRDSFERVECENQQKWDSHRIERIVEEVVSSYPDVKLCADDTDRLDFIYKSIEGIVKYRRVLSTALRSIVERAQKTLLGIVGQELDASEAYATFHDALFRLPSLSQDLSLACLSEMEALVLGVEAMTQSETEALAVVWEALDFSAGDRHDFWARVENQDSTEESTDPFFEIESCAGPECEEWIIEAKTKARVIYKELYRKLRKLEKIHTEVESLRSKQDSKSQILSLDSEIRILNSKIAELEQIGHNQQRLLSKKSSGSKLPKEERFRKQLKSRLISQAGQLANLLRFWEEREGASFDTSLLSDEVRILLEKPDKMKKWTEKGSEHTSKRSSTVRTKQVVNKRPNQETSKGLPSKTIRARHPRTAVPESATVQKSRQELQMSKNDSRNDASRVPVLSDNLKNLKRTREEILGRDSATSSGEGGGRKSRRGDNKALRPFGRILSEVASPNPSEKENKKV